MANGKCRYCGSNLPDDFTGEGCPKCFTKCTYCGDDKMNHSNGRGMCIHCDCTGFRTTGISRDEMNKRHSINMCERPGGRGHHWDEECGDCNYCGKKKAEYEAEQKQ
jgi:hypothetical protein